MEEESEPHLLITCPSLLLQDLSLLLLPIFIVHCCITNNTINCEAANNKHLLSQFPGLRRPETDELGPQSRLSQAEIKVAVGVQSDAQGPSPSSCVVGRIQVLAVVGLRLSPFLWAVS